MTRATTRSEELRALEAAYGARNYNPLPVVIERGEGVWVDDVDGRRYYDALSAYSALNFGHRHPRLVAAAARAARAAHADEPRLPQRPARPLLRGARGVLRKELVLPMNTGAEAVESGDQGRRASGATSARAWPRSRRDRRLRRATSTAARPRSSRFSSDPLARDRLRPLRPRLRVDPVRRRRRAARGDRRAHRRLPRRAGPGRGGRDHPARRATWRRRARSATRRASCSSPTRSRPGSAAPAAASRCDHEDVTPDVYLLGKALGGGILPLSAVVADDEVLGVLNPGEHGSTFGGNPLACAVGREVLRLLEDGRLAEDAAQLGALGRGPAARRRRSAPSPPSARSASGSRSTSSRRPPARARCASGWSTAACSARTRTTTRSASRRRS